MSANPPRVALAGNPNTGKTSLFNRVTGANARVGNYPGVTVERQSGFWRLPRGSVELIDVPGAYSLAARSAEEQVAVRAIFGLDGEARPSVVVVVVDATQVLRNLYLVGQLLEARVPVVVALNLADEARARGVMPDASRLAAALGVPVVPVSAHTGEGMAALADAVDTVLHAPDRGRAAVGWRYPPALEADVTALAARVARGEPAEARALALWALLSVDEEDELRDVPAEVRAEVTAVRQAALAAGRDVEMEIVGSRWAWLDALDLRTPAPAGPSWTDRVDRWLLHPLWGGAAFLIAMAMLFQGLFTWSDPLIALVEAAFGWLGETARGTLPPGLVADFVVDGVLNGFGAVLVFLPQILLLFLLLGFLEDSGYMARVAFLVDRAMKAVGLHGRAFVPMLSGYACAVPAIMATRTLERRRDRLLTMMVVPLMSCSARLPVYTLLIASLFPADGRIAGIVPVQGAAMVGMYLFSTGMALVAAGVLGRTVLRGPKVPLLLELPPYRMPRLATVLRGMALRARMFVTEAGTVILGCTVVLWALLTFPREVPLSVDYDAARATACAQAAPCGDSVATLDAREASERMAGSWGGRLGHAIEPVLAPLGFDWKIGVGLVGAFAAREVFVSTMGVVMGVGSEVDAGSAPLRERLRAEVRPDGTPRYTPLVGVSLMVFFALSAQCMSTLAVVRRESGGWRWPAFLFAYMTVLAWMSSFAVYQLGRLLGHA
jgi:ferrous iron transport protein B